MLVKVRFFGDLRGLMEKNWMAMDIPKGSSLKELILELCNRETMCFGELIGGNKIRPGLAILLNGINITHLNGLETQVKDHDVVSFLPTAGGGLPIPL
jgi:molybdopterin synthase sulfur carrier subunit